MGRDELKHLSKNDLVRLVLALQEEVRELRATLSRLTRDSSTSSKPPSSDIVKPPKPQPPGGRQQRRRIGGQPGHERHERAPFPPEEVDRTIPYRLRSCPQCGTRVRKTGRPVRVLQQVELVERPFQVTEHRALAHWCPSCAKHVEASLPAEVVRGGLLGARMRAFAAYVKGACHASYSAMQSLLRDVLGLSVSRGYLTKVIQGASGALQEPYEELRSALAREPWLNVDETGHKDRGKQMWTWCFRAQRYAVFRIDASRGSDVLRAVLGELFGGVLGADYMAAYQKYAADLDVVLQLCLAHLIRDVRYLTTLPDKVTQNYGHRVVEALRLLFHTLHRRARLTPAQYERAMRRAKANLIGTAKRAPLRTEAQNIAKRFRENADSYFTFMDVDGVEPTNNRAEQAIRHVVIDRRVTQGTRGPSGQRWCERIWTTLATCVEQGRSAFAFLEAAIRAHLTHRTAPSLLPGAAMASGP